MAQTVQLGNLAVNITGSSAEFVRSVKSAKKQANDFKRRVRLMRRDMRNLQRTVKDTTAAFRRFSFILGGVVASVVAVSKRMADFGAELVENARLTGLTIEQYQGVRRLLASDGLGFSKSHQALVRFNEALNDAKLGKGEYLEVFDQLGLDPNTINGVYDGLLKVADALSKITDQETRLAIGSGLFGIRGARAILPLQGGRAQAEEQLDFFTTVISTLTGLQGEALKSLAQAFQNLADEFQTALATVVAENATRIEATLDRIRVEIPEGLEATMEKVNWFLRNFGETLNVLLDALRVWGWLATARILGAGLKGLTSAIDVLLDASPGARAKGIKAVINEKLFSPGNMALRKGVPAGVSVVKGLGITGIAAGAIYGGKSIYDYYIGTSRNANYDRIRGITDLGLLEQERESARANIAGLRATIAANQGPSAGAARRNLGPALELLDVIQQHINFLITPAVKELGDASQEAAGKAVLLTRVLRSEFDLQAVAPGLGRQLGHATVLRNIPGQEGISDFYGLEAVSPGLSPRALARLRVGADLMNEMTDRLRRMRETAAEVGRVFGSAFDRVFRDLFQDFDNFGERLKAVFRDIAADLVSILLSPLRQHIQNLVAGLAFGSGIFVGPGAPSIGGSTPADFRSVFGSNRLFGGATTFGSTAGAAAGGIIAPRINVNATFNSLSAEGNRQLLGSLNRTVGNAVNSALTQRSSGQRRAAASFRGL